MLPSNVTSAMSSTAGKIGSLTSEGVGQMSGTVSGLVENTKVYSSAVRSCVFIGGCFKLSLENNPLLSLRCKKTRKEFKISPDMSDVYSEPISLHKLVVETART